jgi:hypothetical protein
LVIPYKVYIVFFGDKGQSGNTALTNVHHWFGKLKSTHTQSGYKKNKSWFHKTGTLFNKRFSKDLWQWFIHYTNIMSDIVHCLRYIHIELHHTRMWWKIYSSNRKIVSNQNQRTQTLHINTRNDHLDESESFLRNSLTHNSQEIPALIWNTKV